MKPVASQKLNSRHVPEWLAAMAWLGTFLTAAIVVGVRLLLGTVDSAVDVGLNLGMGFALGFFASLLLNPLREPSGSGARSVFRIGVAAVLVVLSAERIVSGWSDTLSLIALCSGGLIGDALARFLRADLYAKV